MGVDGASLAPRACTLWVHCWLPNFQGSTRASAAPTYVSWSILQLFFNTSDYTSKKLTNWRTLLISTKKIRQSSLGGSDNHLVVHSLAEQSTCWRPTAGWIPVKCKPQTSPRCHRQCLWKNSMWSNKFSFRNHTFYCWPQRVITTEHV